MEGIAAALKRASRGADPEDAARALATARVPNALRFSRFKSFDEFEAAGRDLGARAAKARSPEELAAINAEANALQGAYNRFSAGQVRPLKEIEADITALEARAARATTPQERAALEAESKVLGRELEQLAQARSSKGPAFGQGPVSASERAVLESKYPGRYLDPQTGYPQSYASKPVMRDPRAPEEAVSAALNTVRGRPAETPSGMNYLFEPSRRLGVDGKPVTVAEYGFTPGQRLAQAGAAGTVAAGLGASAMRDREEPPSRFTGTSEDAAALMQKYGEGPGPAAERVSPFEESNVAAPEPKSSYFPNRVPDILAPVGPAVAERGVQTARRVATPPSPMQTAVAYADNPTASPSFFSRLFDGGDYQSTGRQVVERPSGERPVINWGSGENAADYFRAAQAMKELEGENPIGRASGGKAGSGAVPKDAALHKALEIIHMMLSRR